MCRQSVLTNPNMNEQTITEKLFDKADKELKARINKSTQWIYDDARQVEHSEKPWIGTIGVQFNELAFDYLREKYRQQAIDDFMAKVNSMAEEMENLGIVVRNNSEQQP